MTTKQLLSMLAELDQIPGVCASYILEIIDGNIMIHRNNISMTDDGDIVEVQVPTNKLYNCFNDAHNDRIMEVAEKYECDFISFEDNGPESIGTDWLRFEHFPEQIVLRPGELIHHV